MTKGAGPCRVACQRLLARDVPHRRPDRERIQAAGHPRVHAEWSGALGNPAVFFYGRYDVRPMDSVKLCRHPFAS